MKKHVLLAAMAFAMSAHVVTAQPEKSAAVATPPAPAKPADSAKSAAKPAGKSATPAIPADMKPVAAQTQAALWASRVLGRYHYKAVPLDDAMSEKIFDRYFKSLDSEKLFFVQATSTGSAPLRTKLDDAINNEDLSVPFAIYNLYQQRFGERMAYARELLKSKFDFIDRRKRCSSTAKKPPGRRAKTKSRDLWRKRVKNDWLRLKLAGKDDKAIRETLDKRYENYVNRIAQAEQRRRVPDVHERLRHRRSSRTPITWARARPTTSTSPCACRSKASAPCCSRATTTRSSAKSCRAARPACPASSRWATASSAWRRATRRHSPTCSAGASTTWSQLIRGDKDSTVRLDVMPADAGPDAKHVTVSLVRKKISMEEQAAKKSIIEGQGKRRQAPHRRDLAADLLPGLRSAAARATRTSSSATRDVARILVELKKDKVDNVLIDLRNNGGGSLTEAVELTGLFIDKGPVVMQRTAEGQRRSRKRHQGRPGLGWPDGRADQPWLGLGVRDFRRRRSRITAAA